MFWYSEKSHDRIKNQTNNLKTYFLNKTKLVKTVENRVRNTGALLSYRNEEKFAEYLEMASLRKEYKARETARRGYGLCGEQ
jgi:hypothetical protein